MNIFDFNKTNDNVVELRGYRSTPEKKKDELIVGSENKLECTLRVIDCCFDGFSDVIIKGFKEILFQENVVSNTSGVTVESCDSSFISGNKFINVTNGISVFGRIGESGSTVIQKNNFTRCNKTISLKNIEYSEVSLNEFIFSSCEENLENSSEPERKCYDQLLMEMDTPNELTHFELKEGLRYFVFHRGGNDEMTLSSYIENWISVCPYWNEEMFYSFYNDERIPDDGFFLILDENNNAVAHSNIQIEEHEKNSATVHFVEVKEEMRGLKLGYCVSNMVIDYAIKHKIPKLFLTTDEFRMNAIKIYYNLGFRPVYFNEEVKERWKPILSIIEKKGVES